MYVIRVELENFKGVKKGSLNFSDVTILLGANNSGKTTVLEALFLAPNPLRPVPYFVRGVQVNAVRLIEELHSTLDSRGFAFLFNDYVAKWACINCIVDSSEHSVFFVNCEVNTMWPVFVGAFKGRPLKEDLELMTKRSGISETTVSGYPTVRVNNRNYVKLGFMLCN